MTIDVEVVDLRLLLHVQGKELDLDMIQGMWTEEQYLKLTDATNVLLEFTDGAIEVVPMPTDYHQVVMLFLYELLRNFVRPLGGKVLVAPVRVQMRSGKYREPDVLLVRDANDPRRQNRFWRGAVASSVLLEGFAVVVDAVLDAT